MAATTKLRMRETVICAGCGARAIVSSWGCACRQVTGRHGPDCRQTGYWTSYQHLCEWAVERLGEDAAV